MSALVVFSVEDDISYQKMVEISKQMILYCFNKNIGVIFNFLGYAEDVIKELESKFYFSISDDFIQLNSEYLSTGSIINFEDEEGKYLFFKQFSFFDEIYEILRGFDLDNISLIISTDGSVESIKEFSIIEKRGRPFVEVLYNTIIEKKEKYAYAFPSMIITD